MLPLFYNIFVFNYNVGHVYCNFSCFNKPFTFVIHSPPLVTPWGRKEKYYKYTVNWVIKKNTRSKNHLRKVHLNALIFVHLQGTFYKICLFYNLIK